uniref:Homeobox-leucine zipper protein HAT22 n=1 Tax=Anthurium amnicola TaxID=1678845 RepID=A0A1D1Z524_9ARAE
MGGEDICDARLVLRLGYEGWATADRRRGPSPFIKMETQLPCSTSPAPVEPALTLSPPEVTRRRPVADHPKTPVGGEQQRLQARQASPHSAASSLSSGAKRERERDVSEEVEAAERPVVSSRASDEEEEGNARKKLRLTKEQSALLEDMFKEHSTLNPKQKQALARQLNLRPRQVEVWFQNRRARTKLKQTEMDCELLKRCCESLTDENRRLQKELQELRALKYASPLYMRLPPATLTMCPSCERMGAAATDRDGAKGASAAPFVLAPKTHFYNPFPAAQPPPAAC